MSQRSLNSSEDVQLIQRIQKLPLEPRNQIEEATDGSAFIGGFFYLHGAPKDASSSEKMPPPNEGLLAVDKYVYAKYKEWLWNANTLTIDIARIANLYPTGEGLNDISLNLGHRHFCKVYLNFSIQHVSPKPEFLRLLSVW
ncbi:MAG: hypothetical protein L6R41_005578 [Letrouitia leprolyta]|nr:MAG: hypothetical protein L6R41_005578 [Letrouitia leprolyta]